jgi:hypothetical protein
MLSITHHTRKRPSTGPRTTQGPQIVFSGHGTRINNHPTTSPVLEISLGEIDPHPGKSQPDLLPFILVVLLFFVVVVFIFLHFNPPKKIE